jgi:hypothetical protein
MELACLLVNWQEVNTNEILSVSIHMGKLSRGFKKNIVLQFCQHA